MNAVWLPPPWQAMAMRVLGMVSSCVVAQRRPGDASEGIASCRTALSLPSIDGGGPFGYHPLGGDVVYSWTPRVSAPSTTTFVPVMNDARGLASIVTA